MGIMWLGLGGAALGFAYSIQQLKTQGPAAQYLLFWLHWLFWALALGFNNALELELEHRVPARLPLPRLLAASC
jgi:hypothetical protein